MATIYPSGIDNNISLPQTVDLVTEVKAQVTNELREAIIAIEAELGIDPSREYGTVRARLDDIQSKLGCNGAISVSEEGVVIVSEATNLNFVGGGAIVTDAGNGVAEIQIIALDGYGGDGYAEQESFVPAASQTVFNLTETPSDPTTVMMFINGIKYEYGNDYIASGNTVTYLAGYVLGPTDVVEFWYLVSGGTGGGGGGGGAIAVQDEGVTVDTNTTTINFIGSTVQALGGAPGTVNVYIPPPTFLSHWNTSDGSNGDQSVTESITRVTARISTPAGGEGTPFNTNGWAGTNQAASVNGTAVFTTPADTTGFGGDSTMTVTVYDADGSTVLDTYTTPAIVGNGANVSPSTRITVTISSFAPDALRFSANASVNVNIAGVHGDNGLTGGRYHVEVVHNTDTTTDGTGPYTYVQSDVFYDTNPTTPAINSTVTVAETGGSVLTKHLSGIEYYIIGSEFTVGVNDVDDLNENTQRQTSNLAIRGSEYGLPDLDVAGFGAGSANFTGWDNNHDTDNINYQQTDWAINQASFRYIGPTGNVSSFPRDPWADGATVNSANSSILVDTFLQTSTDLVENFDDEVYRQDSGFNGGTTVGNWVSTASLGAGEAIVFNSNLMLHLKLHS